MRKHRIQTVLFLCAVFSILLLTPSLAQNPSHLKWREYETEHYIVYYPEGQEFTAYNAIEIAESVYGPLARMYGAINENNTYCHQ